ncbi:Permease of the drug/metabolite transporter (DMT) superfamily [Paenibacillus pasadenensis]|uniref:Permease of the drug/metabolite transporter (DMT) superfamily n=1 Tax=Paenibacillus pasadenensis TaxID=217090 RepID=A0A2N5N6S1_9BACL|nr:Permease of the drug/metabolite transporter (DMT) superfamily [Paenibacillus pasadenensis]
MLVGMAAISFAPILVRFSEAPVSVQGQYRMLLTFLLMLPFAWKQLPAIRRLTVRDWALLAGAGFFLALHFLLWMASLSYTSIASSTIMLTLEPAFVAALAFFFLRDRLGKLAVAGMAVSIGGAVLVSSGDFGLSREAFFGDALSLLSTVAIAFNMILAKRLLERMPSFVYSLIVFGVTTVLFAGYNGAMGYSMTAYPPREWVLFLLLAVIPTVFGHLLFNWLLQHLRATTVSMTVLAEPIGASLLALLLFGETLSAGQLIGGAVMMAGFVIYLRGESSGPLPAAAPKEAAGTEPHADDSAAAPASPAAPAAPAASAAASAAP